MLTSLSYKLKYSGSPKLPIIFYWKVFVSNFKRTHIKAFPGYLEKYMWKCMWHYVNWAVLLWFSMYKNWKYQTACGENPLRGISDTSLRHDKDCS